MGIECEGYKEQFMALFTAIEVDHVQIKKSDSEKKKELKRLEWSLNVGSANWERSKGKGLTSSL